MIGRVLSVHSSECRVAVGEDVVSCFLRGRLRFEDDQVYAGDLVEVSQKERRWVIEKVMPRKNFLIRPPVANVDQAVVVTAITEPPLDFVYIDKILVHLEASNISAVICVNKQDIEDPKEVERVSEVYRKAGYPCVVTSAVTGFGLHDLSRYLESKVTVLAGQSGAGKSKILSALLGVGLLTQGLSRLGRGRHTTKWVSLFRAGRQGYVADTPGFSKLDLIDVEPYELSYYFREMAPYVPLCHFPRCLHKSEDRCRVKEALAAGEISRERYKSYLTLLEESTERAKRKYE
ncbi:MAG TPA: ribosome small subunit-dependent GTPase A [Firmicutes bacterium]|nr:ribosome small subunit-dependent GTPase A [Candidatus Fermentithermobacillaceae bacterium]